MINTLVNITCLILLYIVLIVVVCGVIITLMENKLPQTLSQGMYGNCGTLRQYIAICSVVILTLSCIRGYCSIHPYPLSMQLVVPLIEIIVFICIVSRRQMIEMIKRMINFFRKTKAGRCSLLLLVVIIIAMILLKTIGYGNIVDYCSQCIDKLSNLIDAKEISEQVSDDFIEVVSSVAIGTIIGIMTIALPIIVSTMHSLADRYQTNYVLVLLNRDWTLVTFRILLVFSLILSTTWVVCYFCASEYLCIIAIFLFVVTLVFIISLIILVARLVYFSMPDKLFYVVKYRLNNYEAPETYFDSNVLNNFQPWGTRAEKKRLQLLKDHDKYDSEITRLLVIVARVFAIFGFDTLLRKEILDFWASACHRASFVSGAKVKYYTNAYYNFIYELADWAISHNNAKLEEETITFLNILLKAHIGKPRKIGEPLTEEHMKKYIFTMETFECMWKIMRKSVNCPNEDMFKKYWQIVNNFYSLKYKDVNYPVNDDIKRLEEVERKTYLKVHYLCCSYLMGRRKYNLIEYVLNYSQQSNFEWYLIPNKAESVVTSYYKVKDWYVNWYVQQYFSFTEDYNLFDDMIVKKPIAQYTTLLLLIFGKQMNQLKELKVEVKYQSYLYPLIDMVKETTNETDWIKALQLDNLLEHKDGIIAALESLLEQPRTPVPSMRFTRNGTSDEDKNGNCFRQLISFFKRTLLKMKSWIDKEK